MKYTSFEHMNCSMAQALDIVGERWSLLIIRDAAFGIRRFDDFQKNLGIARNILTKRLKRLTSEGILRKTMGRSGRMEYRLTEKGWDLQPIMLALFDWGEKYKPHPSGKRLYFVDRETGQRIAPMAVRSSIGQLLGPGEVWAKRGTGTHQVITE